MLVEMRGISKSFGGAPVLSDVSFDVAAGEVHVLAGENGAGKSTLIRILSGAETQFEGSLWLDGRRLSFGGPLDAISAGIATIHQELSLAGPMSVADNLYLGRERLGPGGVVARRAQEREAARLLAQLGLDIDPACPVDELPIATQQLVEIARALAREARVLVMDEPTSALDDHEAGLLFDQVARLRADGRAIVYITHRMEEIYALADRITVLRDGVHVGTTTPAELPKHELVAWMAGAVPTIERVVHSPEVASMALEAEGLRVPGPAGALAVRGVTLGVRRGEIVGLAGLRGSGASELLHGLFGSRPSSGAVALAGERFDDRSPARSIRRGLVLLPSDRRASGLCGDASVIDSAILASLERFSRAGFVRPAAARAEVQRIAELFRLRAPSLDAPVHTLSGGNQQKVLIARCALARPAVLLLDEPTRGVDVAAKADIHRAVRRWAADGAAVLLATSDTEELLELCDTVLVLARGEVVARLSGSGATRDAVLAAAMGAEPARTAS